MMQLTQTIPEAELSDRLAKAAQLLKTQNFTCVILGENTVYTSTDRGIRPLLSLCTRGSLEPGCSAADKVVGKAAALLYILLDIKELYAGTVSQSALALLQQAGIAVICGTVTDAIINRAGTGLCPMERAVQNIHEPLEAITQTLADLSRNTPHAKKIEA